MSTRRRVAVIAAALLAGPGCAEEAKPPVATPCPVEASVSPPESLPRVLDQTRHGEVVQVGRRKGFTAVRLISEETVVELYPQLARGLLEGGHEILTGDNEGFEAEIFFALRDGRTGRYVLREGPCKDEVTLHVLYEEER